MLIKRRHRLHVMMSLLVHIYNTNTKTNIIYCLYIVDAICIFRNACIKSFVENDFHISLGTLLGSHVVPKERLNSTTFAFLIPILILNRIVSFYKSDFVEIVSDTMI